MGNDLVERLRSAMCPGSERCNVLTCYPDCECGAMEAAAARITELQRELAEAREAALEEVFKTIDDQMAIYDTKIAKAIDDSDTPRWDRMDNYRDALDHIRGRIENLRRAARAYANKGQRRTDMKKPKPRKPRISKRGQHNAALLFSRGLKVPKQTA